MPTTNPHRATTIVLLVGALACAAAAGLVPTAAWLGWFEHPGRGAMPETSVEGVRWLRVMLGVLVVTLTGCAALVRYVPAESRSTGSAPTEAPGSSAAWIVFGLLVLALLLRATRITESLWYDEIAMWLTYGLAGPGAIVGHYFDPVNHIAHTLVTWLSVHVTEPAVGMELALRLPALLASLAAVPIVFALVRRAFPRGVAAVAAGMMAVLPAAVLSGVEARGYSMVIVLSAASTWALFEARTTDRPALWLVYALLAAATVWTHMVAVCVFLGHGLWITWTAWRDGALRAWVTGAAALGLAAVMTLTLYAPVLPEVMGQVAGNFQLSDADQPTLWGEQGVRMLWQLGGAWTWWAAAPGLVLAALGFVWLWRDRVAAGASQRRELMALLWLGLPVAGLMVGGLGTWVYARFMLFAAPASAVTMALGIALLWSWRREAAVAALALVVGVSVLVVMEPRPKQPLREAAMYVREHRAAHERVLSVDIAHAVMRMYAGGMPMAFSFMHGRDLPRELDAQSPAWIVVLYPEHLSADAAEALQARGYRAVQRFEGWLDDGDVVVYRR